jgi:hypothetical protein
MPRAEPFYRPESRAIRELFKRAEHLEEEILPPGLRKAIADLIAAGETNCSGGEGTAPQLSVCPETKAAESIN